MASQDVLARMRENTKRNAKSVRAPMARATAATASACPPAQRLQKARLISPPGESVHIGAKARRHRVRASLKGLAGCYC